MKTTFKKVVLSQEWAAAMSVIHAFQMLMKENCCEPRLQVPQQQGTSRQDLSQRTKPTFRGFIAQ